MTSLSDYLRAERFDNTEPASFYIPGITDWDQIRRRDARAYLIGRGRQRGEDLDFEDDEQVTVH